jgi:hypothetical protein
MHFEILVEDQSGQKLLERLLPKIFNNPQHTYKVISYKGIGKIPAGIEATSDANKRILLDQLPRLLKGYGKAYQNYPAAIIVVCDLDDKCLKTFRTELLTVLERCSPKPQTYFCIAIEEGEAWLLGDIQAVKSAYPKAKDAVLKEYINDSICGTWEVLANAVYSGGAEKLKKSGWQARGREKSIWAETITPHLQLERNKSPSFNYFVAKLKKLSE